MFSLPPSPRGYLLTDLVEFIYRVSRRPYLAPIVPRFLLRSIARVFEITPFTPWLSREMLELVSVILTTGIGKEVPNYWSTFMNCNLVNNPLANHRIMLTYFHGFIYVVEVHYIRFQATMENADTSAVCRKIIYHWKS